MTKPNQCHHHYHPRNHQTHPSSVILETHRSVHRSLRALYLGRHIPVHWVSLNMENKIVLHFKRDIFYFHSSANLRIKDDQSRMNVDLFHLSGDLVKILLLPSRCKATIITSTHNHHNHPQSSQLSTIIIHIFAIIINTEK